jgi:hypothetical protein
VAGDRRDDEPCWRLELDCHGERALFPRIRYWMDRDSHRPRAIEYYGRTGALLQTARFRDYRQGPTGLRANRIEVTNEVHGRISRLDFSDFRYVDRASASFEPHALVGLRDAVVRGNRGHGRGLRIEDLLSDARRPPAGR